MSPQSEVDKPAVDTTGSPPARAAVRCCSCMRPQDHSQGLRILCLKWAFIRHLNTREGPKNQRVAGMTFEKQDQCRDMGSMGKSARQKAEGPDAGWPTWEHSSPAGSCSGMVLCTSMGQDGGSQMPTETGYTTISRKLKPNIVLWPQPAEPKSLGPGPESVISQNFRSDCDAQWIWETQARGRNPKQNHTGQMVSCNAICDEVTWDLMTPSCKKPFLKEFKGTGHSLNCRHLSFKDLSYCLMLLFVVLWPSAFSERSPWWC